MKSTNHNRHRTTGYSAVTTRRRRKRRKKNNSGGIFLVLLVLIILSVAIFYIVSNAIKSSDSKSGVSSNADNSSVSSGSLSGGNNSGVISESANSSTSSADFWGNEIDFSKNYPVVETGNILKKWPAASGFDIVKTDISSYKSREFNNGALSGITVILDPGHGGEDMGAVFPVAPIKPAIVEARINLIIANIVKVKLENIGAKVVLTRTDDKYYRLYYRSAVTAKITLKDFYDKLSPDSSNRSLISNYISKMDQTIQVNDDKNNEQWFYGLGVRRELKNILDLQRAETNFLYLSLHCNSTVKTDTLHGIRVFYSTNKAIYDDEVKIDKDKIFPEYQNYDDAERQRFATILHENIVKDNPEMAYFDKTITTTPINYSVIREENLVSALVEMGYVNHSADRAFLLDPVKQDEMATSITRGIYEYYCK
ncbi:MAG: N-acetylmuramoyl-L-alanine amidase family protein [Saccharofermentanales bacterium]